jgi:uncharacterized membrane protein
MFETLLSALGSLHVPILLATILGIIYSDHQAWLYFRGTKKTLSPKFTTWSHRIVGAGLAGMIVSGVALVTPAWQFYLSDPVFYIKMWFVLVLIINAVAIGKLVAIAHTEPFFGLKTEQKTTLLVSGFLSGVSWVAAIVVGYFFL